MNDQDTKKVLKSLQTFNQLLEKDDLYTDVHQKAFEQVCTLLSQDGHLQEATDLMPVSVAAENFLNRVIEAIDQACRDDLTSADLIQLRLEMGEIYYLLGNWDEALKRLMEALSLSEQARDLVVQAEAYAGIGRIQSRRSVWKEATEALHRALSIYQKIRDLEGQAKTLLLLGNAAFLLGSYEKARVLFKDALKAGTDGSMSSEAIGDIHLSLGVVEQVCGHANQAAHHFGESSKRFKEIGDQKRMSQAYFNMGIVHVEQGAWIQAGRYYEQSLTNAKESGDLSMVGMIYLRRGEMQVKLSDSKLALRYGRRAMDVFEQLEMISGKADVYKLFGDIATMTDTPDDARIFLAESRRLQQASGSRLGEAEVAESEAAMHEQEDDYMQATARYHYAKTQLQNLGAEGSHSQRVEDALLRLQNRIPS
jgi:tetratricopeptide (TPR) repeat protein